MLDKKNNQINELENEKHELQLNLAQNSNQIEKDSNMFKKVEALINENYELQEIITDLQCQHEISKKLQFELQNTMKGQEFKEIEYKENITNLTETVSDLQSQIATIQKQQKKRERENEVPQNYEKMEALLDKQSKQIQQLTQFNEEQTEIINKLSSFSDNRLDEQSTINAKEFRNLNQLEISFNQDYFQNNQIETSEFLLQEKSSDFSQPTIQKNLNKQQDRIQQQTQLNKLEELEKQFEQLEQKCMKLKDENEHLINFNKSLQDQNNTINQNFKEKNQLIINENGFLKEQIKLLNDNQQKLINNYSIISKPDSKEDYKSLQEKIQKLESDNQNNLFQEKKLIEQELVEFKQKYQNQVKSNKKVENKIKQLEQIIEDKNKELQEMNLKICEMEQNTQSLKTSFDHLNAQTKNIQTEKFELNEKLLEEMMEEQNLRKEINKLELSLNEKVQEKIVWLELKAQLEQQLSKFQEKTKPEKENSFEEEEFSFKNSDGGHPKFQDLFEKMNEEIMTKMNSKLEDIENAYEQSQNKIKTQILRMSESKGRSSESILDFQNQQIIELQKQLAQAEHKNYSLTQQVGDLTNQNQTSLHRFQQEEIQDQNYNEFQKYTGELSQLNTENIQLRKNILELQQLLNEKDKQISQLTEEITLQYMNRSSLLSLKQSFTVIY